MGRPSDNPFENLGRVIKALRAEAGLSRGDLADRAGISYSYLAEIENGTKQPSTKTLVEIAQALALEAHDLMERGTRLHEVPEVDADRVSATRAAQHRVVRSAPMPSRVSSEPPAWLRPEADPPGRTGNRVDPPKDWRLMLVYWRRLADEDRRILLEMAERLAGE